MPTFTAKTINNNICEKEKPNGKQWLKNSISIWDDLKKTKEEKKLKHPAMFPASLPEKILECYTFNVEKPIVLDPFCGSGSTLIAASMYNATGIGFDIVDDFINTTKKRLFEYGKDIIDVNKNKTLKTIEEGKFYSKLILSPSHKTPSFRWVM